MTINKTELNSNLLKRVESIDNQFIGYNGDKYVYILDIEVSQIKGTIINKFWILNEVDENTFIRIPNNDGSFIFETRQSDGSVFRNINGEPIYIYDGDLILMEDIEVQVGEDENGPIYEINERPVVRNKEFTRNIEQFAPVIGPAIEITIKRYLSEEI
jgi:hypothetical protein